MQKPPSHSHPEFASRGKKVLLYLQFGAGIAVGDIIETEKF
jgi:hypothetical protein